MGISLFKDARADGRFWGGVSILVKDAVPAVRHHLPDIPHNDGFAYEIGSRNLNMHLSSYWGKLLEWCSSPNPTEDSLRRFP